MRLSEVLGLQWGDVDFENAVIRLRRQADRRVRRAEDTPCETRRRPLAEPRADAA
jgi:integrase